MLRYVLALSCALSLAGCADDYWEPLGPTQRGSAAAADNHCGLLWDNTPEGSAQREEGVVGGLMGGAVGVVAGPGAGPPQPTAMHEQFIDACMAREGWQRR